MSSRSRSFEHRKRNVYKNGNSFSGGRVTLSILMISIGLVIVLSIISYTPRDQANVISISEIGKIFTGDERVREKLERTHNWVGFVGAKISFFLINYTFGYSSILVGLILITLGFFLFFDLDKGYFLRVTLYTLFFSFLLSVLLGNFKLIFGTEEFKSEICGRIGLYTADILIKLFGKFGALFITFASFVIFLGFLIELNFYELAINIGEKVSLLFKRLKVDAKPVKSSDVKILKSESSQVQKRTEVIISGAELPIGSSFREEVNRVDKTRALEEKQEDLNEKPKKAEKEFSSKQAQLKSLNFNPPPIDLLDPSEDEFLADEEELALNAELLKNKLANFDIEVEKISITPGPVVTLYEIVPAADVKVREIVSLADDIALALAAPGIRVIAPMPGKGTVGIEIPNRKPSIVRIRSVIESSEFKGFRGLLPVAMGKTITGEIYCDDLAKMPHLLIGGATGSGKSVGINTIIVSLLYKLPPSDIKFVIIDPKRVELINYRKLINHYLAICPDIDEEIITTPENAVLALKSLVLEMNERYDKLSKAGARNIQDYNEKIRQGRFRNAEDVQLCAMPYIVVVIDELADLMLVASGDVEEPITRLAQLARGVGIHLVVATQRPSVDVITGVIKANFPTRVAYQVASKVDSRTILDMNGAEQLLGSGDMLYLPAGATKPIRIQNAYVSTEEVERVVEYIASQPGYDKPYELPSVLEKQKIEVIAGDEFDELFEEAAKIVVRYKQASTSLLQRKLKIGYARAARIVDQLEREGIVSPPAEGNRYREVLIENEFELEKILKKMRNK